VESLSVNELMMLTREKMEEGLARLEREIGSK